MVRLNNCVDSFKKYFTTQIGPKHRHRKDFTTATGSKGYQRQQVNLVPRLAQNNASDFSGAPSFVEKNHKIETLKKAPGRFFCDGKDVDFITKTYLKGSAIKPGEIKMLGGKMGIKFYQDAKTGKYIIEK
jgi:hypothetical protein